MAVHYQFKSCNFFEKITFEGGFISLGALKAAIIEQKKMTGRSSGFDLLVSHAQSNEGSI